ncbi:MAG: histidine phosphatase family protein [Spirochaetales bacterium]|nr:histidine phosphatase family protein [Spirochaetales bacterium]
MKLYFMRHGESEANSLDILASRKDFALTERGKKDAEEISREFPDRVGPLTGIISSPLKRARQTAEPFCRLTRREAEIIEAVTEQELGDFAGMTYAEIENAPGYETDRTKRWEWVPRGGGESYAMIAERIKPFFKDMEERNLKDSSQALLVVTHAVTLRLIRAFLEKTLPHYPREIAHNGEIWEVDYDKAESRYDLKIHLLGEAARRNSRA